MLSLTQKSSLYLSCILVILLSTISHANVSAPEFLFQFTGFPKLSDVAINADGNIAVLESAVEARVAVFDKCGNFLFDIESGVSAGFQFPNGIATTPDGNYIVADTGHNRIEIFDSCGNFLFTFGQMGGGNGDFDSPRGVAVAEDGRIAIVDGDNYRVQVFDPCGNFLFKFGSGPSFGDGVFIAPGGIAITSDGHFLVTDSSNGLQVFDKSGNFLFRLDEPFMFATYVAIDDAGNILVTDSGTNLVNVFDQCGDFLFSFTNAQFNSPGGIAVTQDCVIYVVSLGNDQVLVFK